MSAIHGLLHRLRVFFSPERYAREVEREIRFHLELDALQRRAGSDSQLQAELTARKAFGNVTFTSEEVRRMNGLHVIDRARQNILFALRGLRRSPAFTLGVVLTLALGLGVNAAMYSFIDQVFARPPAGVSHPEDIRRLYFDVELRDQQRVAITTLRYPQVREVLRAVDTSVQIGAFVPGRDSISVVAGSQTFPARRRLATTGYFRTLGVRPHLGRFFDPIEDRVEVPSPVAVISHALWRRAFEADPRAVGSQIRIGKRTVTIVGVAGEGFAGIDLDRVDLWMPIGNYNTEPPQTPPWYETYRSVFSLIARVPDARAEQRFLDLSTRAARSVRITNYGFDTLGFMRTGPIVEAAGPGRRLQEVSIAIRLAGVSLIVLLIAVANVINMLLVRGIQRAREFAIRRAVGVSRWRLIEQLLTESVVLAGIAGALSLVLAFWVGSALRILLMPRVNWVIGVVDLEVVLVGGVAALLVGVVVGIIPALQSWEPGVVGALKAGTRGSGYRGSRLRNAMLVAQAALSIVLLVGAGLFVRSLKNVERIPVGYDWNSMILATAEGNDAIAEQAARAMPVLMERIAKLPGVDVVAASNLAPMRGYTMERVFLPGRDSLPMVAGNRGASYLNVTPGFFAATGLELIAGRGFTASDPQGVVVDKRMADAWWPGESAIGKCVLRGSATAACTPVIGLTRAANSLGIMRDQLPAYFAYDPPYPRGVLIVRAERRHHARIVSAMREEFLHLVPEADFIHARPLAAEVETETRPWRLGATLFTAMGALALVVATIGIYSVVSYAASQRTHEMGIRIALGAQAADILRLVLGEGLRAVIVGVIGGIVLALAGGRLVASLLYGVSPRDPAVIGIAAATLAAIGIVAALVPGARAARVDPVSSLRAE